MESFTSANIAELCRRYGDSVAQFHRWKERFPEAEGRWLLESSKGNDYQKEIDDQALVIDAFKNINSLKFR